MKPNPEPNSPQEREQLPLRKVELPPGPRRYYKGRPIITDEDRKQMEPHLPPETEWVKELLGE